MPFSNVNMVEPPGDQIKTSPVSIAIWLSNMYDNCRIHHLTASMTTSDQIINLGQKVNRIVDIGI